jgi:hypothetical protein
MNFLARLAIGLTEMTMVDEHSQPGWYSGGTLSESDSAGLPGTFGANVASTTCSVGAAVMLPAEGLTRCSGCAIRMPQW